MSKNEFSLIIAPDGLITAIYDDELADLLEEASTKTITRASFVEPTANGQWEADLAPSGGPVLGPFKLREEALIAERKWLEQELFGGNL
jgi:hypothetical protein